MKNKKLLFSLGALAFAIGSFWSSFTSATSFQLKIERLNAYWKSVANSIIPIHFADNWNDFWGFLYFSNWYLNLEKDNCPEGDHSWDAYDDECDGDSPVIEDDEGLSWETYYIKNMNGDNIYECKTRVKWFYYNAERGERLRPLDTETWATIEGKYWLTTEGGFYTQCRKAWYEQAYQACENLKTECPEGDTECEVSNIDAETCTKQVDLDYPSNDWYFWQLKHTYSEQDFGLVIWARYKDDGVWYNINKEANDVDIDLGTTFIRFNKQFPLWFVYDYNGWLWFAWCEIKAQNKEPVLEKLYYKQDDIWSLFVPNQNGGIKYNGVPSSEIDCENIWTAADSLIKLVIEWLIGMNRESDLWVIWNQTDVKMQYFSSSDINNATLLNYVKERSEILCRWKWKKDLNSANNNAIKNSFWSSNVVCLEFTSKWSVDTEISSWTKENWKTLIVKNADVIVDPSNSKTDSKNYDIFINGWNLIINEAGDPKFVFTTQWFIAQDKEISDFKDDWRPIYASDGTLNYEWNLSGVWSYIRWNFIVDWNVMGPDSNNGKLNNKYFIYWKFTTIDSFADLEETFAWRCSNGYVINKKWKPQDNQWLYCPPSTYKTVNEQKIYDWYNPYEWAALVVIDQNYNSPLYW
jgi:hypothetical protein